MEFNRLGTDITTPQWQNSNSWNFWIFLGITLFILFSIFGRSRDSDSRRSTYSSYSGGGDDDGGGGGGGGG